MQILCRLRNLLKRWYPIGMQTNLLLVVFLYSVIGICEAPIQSRTVEVFNDKVFDLEAKEKAQKTTTTSANGNVRSVGPDVQYNKAQRDKAIEICEPKRQVSHTEFRKCFNEEMKKMIQGTKENIDTVEENQKRGLKKSPSLWNDPLTPKVNED